MRLSFRLAAAFVAFVVLGSLALVAWQASEERRQSRAQFTAMARTNAELIRSQNLPLTERTAKPLSEALGVEVYFHWPDGLTIPAQTSAAVQASEDATRKLVVLSIAEIAREAAGAVSPVNDGFEAVAVPLRENARLLLIRGKPQGAVIASPRTLAILAAFWIFSLALAWALARGIVRPLRSLAARLPHITEEGDTPIPETTRTDEIGQLARAYSDTRAQLAAERAAREQAERMAALGKMATSLAHEINNPVSAIKLHAQLLEEATGGATPLREEIGIRLPIILAESAKIEGLVSQWMFLARPQPPQMSPCDLAEILAATIRTLAPAASHAGVQIINNLPSATVVLGDRRRLSQAITNVITNAIHAMAARGGVLTIEGRRSKLDGARTCAPRPSTSDSPVTLEIAFTDTGPGFSESALSRATDLFFSEKEGGMGIGLNVTAGIIRAHGGELRIANAPGGGAVVTFLLPASG